jgi:hypothetical protein
MNACGSKMTGFDCTFQGMDLDHRTQNLRKSTLYNNCFQICRQLSLRLNVPVYSEIRNNKLWINHFFTAYDLRIACNNNESSEHPSFMSFDKFRGSRRYREECTSKSWYRHECTSKSCVRTQNSASALLSVPSYQELLLDTQVKAERMIVTRYVVRTKFSTVALKTL